MEKKALQRKKPSRKHWKKNDVDKKTLEKPSKKLFFKKKKLWEKNNLIEKKTSTPSQKKQPLWEKKSLKKKNKLLW